MREIDENTGNPHSDEEDIQKIKNHLANLSEALEFPRLPGSGLFREVEEELRKGKTQNEMLESINYRINEIDSKLRQILSIIININGLNNGVSCEK